MKLRYVVISILMHILLLLKFNYRVELEKTISSVDAKNIQVALLEKSSKPSSVKKTAPTLDFKKAEKNMPKMTNKKETIEYVKNKDTKKNSPASPDDEKELVAEDTKGPVEKEIEPEKTKENEIDEVEDEKTGEATADKTPSIEEAPEEQYKPVEMANGEFQKKDLGENFVESVDGSWTAKNQNVDGLSISFVSTPSPKYPSIARKLGFKGEVVVKVRFLVGLDGKVEDIKFYTDSKKYGFESEVKKALENWKLEPIKYGKKTVKVYFYKTFRFKS